MTTAPLRKAPRQLAADVLAEMDADELTDHGCAYAEYYGTCDNEYLSGILARIEALTDNNTAFAAFGEFANSARFAEDF